MHPVCQTPRERQRGQPQALSLVSLESRNSRALGYDYPAGAEHDPRAPYNQRDPDNCEACDGKGTVDRGDGDEECPDCDGTGDEHEPSREEIAIEKADAEMDREKDEPREL